MRLLTFLLLVAGAAVAQTPPAGWVNIVSLHSGKCLEIKGGPTATSPGTFSQQWTCLGPTQTNQIFQLAQESSGYRIEVLSSGLAIGPLNGATASGTRIEQASFDNSNSFQTWIIKPAATPGYFTLRPATDANSCMDVSSPSASNGAAVLEWGCWGGANQQWKFVPVAVTPSPAISEVSPNNGSTEGGTGVTISGKNFAPDATVTFGGIAADTFVVSPTEITAKTPAASAGPVPVAVTSPGTPSVKLASSFSFQAAAASPTIAYVQGNNATPQTSQSTITVAFKSAQSAGNLNVVAVGWNDSTAAVSAVTDSRGNTYARAVGPTVQSGTASQSIYYAKSIAAGTNTVTVKFNSAAKFADIRVLEYAGADKTNPVDVAAATSGNSATSSSGSVTTHGADLIFAANLVQTTTSGPGTGFTERMVTSPDGDIAEDQMAAAVGSYTASARLSSSGPWIMQTVAFRTPSSATPAPPTSPAPPPPSAPPTAHSVSLTWRASTSSNVASYRVYRAVVPSINYAQVGAGIVSPSYKDSNVTGGTTYTYVVTALDSSGSESAYSNSATAAVPST